jgi:uncharacterized protein (TIGR02266 family)
LVNLKLEKLSGAVTEVTSDLSLGGMFVPSDTPAEIGSLVAFEFKVGEELVEGTGEVVWHRLVADGADQPPGMGIRFRYLSPGSRERIFRLVQRYTKEGDEALKQLGEEPASELPPQSSAVSVPPPAPARPRDKPTWETVDATAKPFETTAKPPEITAEMPGTAAAPPSAPRSPASPDQAAPRFDFGAPPFPSPAAPDPSLDPLAAEMHGSQDDSPGAGRDLPSPPSFAPLAPPPGRGNDEHGDEEDGDDEEAAEMPLAQATPQGRAAASYESSEIPHWLRSDPPAMPDYPSVPASVPESPAELALRAEAPEESTGTGDWPVRGAGVAGARRARSKMSWRAIGVGLLVAVLLAAALYRLGLPLLERWRGEGGAESGALDPSASEPTPSSAAGQTAQPAADRGDESSQPAVASNADPAAPVPEPANEAEPVPASIADPPPGAGAAQADPVSADQSESNAAPPPPPAPSATATARPAPAAAAETAASGEPMRTIQAIRFQRVPQGTLLTIAGDGAITAERVRRQRLGAPPPRDLIRISGVLQPFAPGQIEVGTAELLRVRVGLHPGDELHVVLDLTSASVEVVSTDFVGDELRVLLRNP